MCEDIGNGVVDQICGLIVDICKIILLICGDNMLYEGLLESGHFTEETHFFGVRDAHVGFHVGGRSNRNY